MVHRCTCPNGHQWDAGGLPPAGSSASVCPVCGSAADGVTPSIPALVADTPVNSPAAVPPPAAASELPRADWPSIPGYEIVGELGRGGMGVVYRARQHALDRWVALKVILASEHAGDEDRRRFRNEAEAAAQLNHPNIVAIYEIGQEHGHPYYTMELIDGQPLHRLPDANPRPPRPAAQLIEGLARAVHYAHQRGVVHRDLKPANILRMADGTLKIADFGLAKRLQGGPQGTRSGKMLGTPEYMAPEQVDARQPIGPAADVYALGVMLYEMLTGRTPFEGDSLAEIIRKLEQEEPLSPAWWQPGLPRDLETICLKCLRKEPARRYASALALADDLRRFLAHQPITARRTPAWERGWKLAKRHPTAATLAGSVVLLLLLAGVSAVWYLNAYVWEKVEFYATWVKREGAYEGVMRLTAEQTRHRYVSYKFHKRAGRVEKVEVINGLGHLTNRAPLTLFLDDMFEEQTPSKRECVFEFWHDPNGRVTDEVAKDCTGQVIWRFHYTTPDMAQFLDRTGICRPRTPSGAAQVALTRSAEGYDLKAVHYLDVYGHKQPGRDKTFGFKAECDPRGFLKAVTFLGPRDEPTQHRSGFTEAKLDYDEWGNVKEVAFYGPDGRRAVSREGYSRKTMKYDAYGNRIEEAFYGPDDRLTFCRDGYAKTVMDYDDRGNLTTVIYRGLDDQPKVNKDGVARVVMDYDQRGREVKETYLDAALRPTLHRQGYAAASLAYDDADRPTKISDYGLDGKPALIEGGFAAVRIAYDAAGNEAEKTWIDANGQPTLGGEWFAQSRTAYDQHGNAKRQDFYDQHGRLTLRRGGYATVVKDYDERGNVTQESFLGLDGQPTVCNAGWATVQRDYDARGNCVGEIYRGTDGKPVLGRNGYARVERGFDDRGNAAEETYFGVNHDQRVLCKGNYWKVKRTYNPQGNLTAWTFFGADDQPTTHRDGNHKGTLDYDARGNRKRVAYWGVQGQPVLVGGYHELTETVDEYGRTTSSTSRGLHQEPLLALRYDRDPRGNVAKKTRLGEDGKPRPWAGGRVAVEQHHDLHDRMTEEKWRGAKGERALDAQGKYWRKVVDYNERGLPVAETYYDLQDKPVLVTSGKYGHARITWGYDDRGNRIRETRYALDEQHLPRREVVQTRWAYNARGYQTEEAFYEGERLRAGPKGYARAIRSVDDLGHVTNAVYHDAEDKPVCVHAVVMAAGKAAAELGLKPHDILIAYDGREIANGYDFVSRRNAEKPGTGSRELTIWRDDKSLTLQIPPGKLGVQLDDCVIPSSRTGRPSGVAMP